MNADFEIVLLRAFESGKPLCFNLKSGKVYVGSLVGAVDPTDSRDMLRILPYISGFRSMPEFEVEFRTFYRKIYDKIETENGLNHLDPEDFEKAFNFNDVESVHIFDIAAYVELQQAEHSSNQGEHSLDPLPEREP